jgi:hypothetical protein
MIKPKTYFPFIYLFFFTGLFIGGGGHKGGLGGGICQTGTNVLDKFPLDEDPSTIIESSEMPTKSRYLSKIYMNLWLELNNWLL